MVEERYTNVEYAETITVLCVTGVIREAYIKGKMSTYCICGSIKGLHLIYECRLKEIALNWYKVWRYDGKP